MEPEVEAPERVRALVSLAQPRYRQGGVEVADGEVVEAVVVLDVVTVLAPVRVSY
jgi:hypothetical protein